MDGSILREAGMDRLKDVIADKDSIIMRMHEEMNDLKATIIKLQGERQALVQALRICVSNGEIDPFHELK